VDRHRWISVEITARVRLEWQLVARFSKHWMGSFVGMDVASKVQVDVVAQEHVLERSLQFMVHGILAVVIQATR